MSSSFELNVNGNLYSATSALVRLFGTPYVGLRTLTYKEEVPTNPVDGTGQVSLGRVQGVYKASVSIEIVLHHGQLLVLALQKKANSVDLGGWGQIPFEIETQFREAPPLGLSAVNIRGAKVMSSEEGIQTGGEAAVLKMELNVIRPIRRTIKGVVCTMVPDPADGPGGNTILVGGGGVGTITAALTGG